MMMHDDVMIGMVTFFPIGLAVVVIMGSRAIFLLDDFC